MKRGKEALVRGQLRYHLFGLAMRNVARDDPLFDACMPAVIEAIDHPALNQLELSVEKLDALFSLSNQLATHPKEREKANLVALLRLNADKGFDPMKLPLATKLLRCEDGEKSNAAYRILLDAFGLLAIAWQLFVYGRRIVLTEESFKRTVARRSGPPN